MKRYFTEREIQLANIHMKRKSVFLSAGETQIETTVRLSLHAYKIVHTEEY